MTEILYSHSLTMQNTQRALQEVGPSGEPTTRRDLSIVVPTKNEAANVGPLVDALAETLLGRSVEVIFVDDSDDGTAERVRDVALLVARGDFDVRLIERKGEQRTGGLSGAVRAGIAEASSRWVCVMDGDLQHPPSVIIDLLDVAMTEPVDLVTASRYQPEASNGGLARWPRKLLSSMCGRAARWSFPHRLAQVSDPMSGFFLIDKTKIDLSVLRPRGFKILLELVVTHRELRVAEVPFTFAPRAAGVSKASVAQGLAFAHQLLALRLGTANRRTWQYNVHNLIAVESDCALPELEKFLVESLPRLPKISVRVGRLGKLPCGESIDATNPTPTVGYRERSGFAMSLNVCLSEVSVVVSPFVARSPHVMYTNVVEPILRWRLVELGYALVHAACFADGEHAYLVTARTDTGKTTTMLKVLDGSDLAFVSDDLVIMSPDGVVLSFPKPLTISAHTVHALKDTSLSRFERAKLVPQSRIHSREGRRLAFLLTKYRLPVASINAIIQRVVPPPKYHVERLVPHVRSASAASVAGMFVIERGGTGDHPLDREESLTTLLSNCADAFGFPPYSSLERLLLAVSDDDLRTTERDIIARAITGLNVQLMRSETLDWAVRIPEVVGTWPRVPQRVARTSEVRSA
jgi:hypothetical protein